MVCPWSTCPASVTPALSSPVVSQKGGLPTGLTSALIVVQLGKRPYIVSTLQQAPVCPAPLVKGYYGLSIVDVPGIKASALSNPFGACPPLSKDQQVIRAHTDR